MKINPEFKKFFINTLLFLVSVLLISLSLLFISLNFPKFSSNACMFALLDKHANLEKPYDGDRIIFIGGSNTSQGLDSPKIEKALDKKVINMGLNGGLGLKFILNDIKYDLHENDTLIIIPEYMHFFGDSYLGGSKLTYTLMYMYPEKISILDTKQFFNLIKYVPNSIFLRFIDVLKDEYYDGVCMRDKFNSNGDLLGHLERSNDGWNDTPIADVEVNDEVIKFISEFSNEMTTKNVKVYFMYSVYENRMYQQGKEKIQEIQNKLENGLDILIISNPERYALDRKYFYDNSYHLNKEGREIRTNLVIEDLENLNNHRE